MSTNDSVRVRELIFCFVFRNVFCVLGYEMQKKNKNKNKTKADGTRGALATLATCVLPTRTLQKQTRGEFLTLALTLNLMRR